MEILKKGEYDFYLGKARCNNREDMIEEIKSVKPTHIVSFIGRTHGCIGDKKCTTIDYLEQEGKLVENVRDNLYSPIMLAMLSKEYNFHYTYLGTGCIFKFDEMSSFWYGREWF